MKLIFNDGAELTIQQAYVDSAGALRIKTISATQEQLRALFQDTVKTAKMTVEEMGQTQAVYEGYTRYDGTMVYTGGILEPCLYKKGETPAEIMAKLQAEKHRAKCSQLVCWKCQSWYISNGNSINQFNHIIHTKGRYRNDGNVMGTADYVR